MVDNNNTYKRDVLAYESDIWACADLLISSGIKQSKFPDYMMPFFALIMLEGRMKNEIADIEATEGITRESDKDGFIEAFNDRDCGFNSYLVGEGKTLADICGKVDEIVSKIELEISKLKELKRSLINEVVTGQRPIK